MAGGVITGGHRDNSVITRDNGVIEHYKSHTKGDTRK